MFRKIFLFQIVFSSFIALNCSNLSAITLKIGVLAPEGTSWAINLKKMVKEISLVTNKEVRFKIYFNGKQGDEPDVLRKIRVGQLHGGIFSGKTLGDINGDVRVIEIPFTFDHDRTRAWKTVENMAPFFNKKFIKNEFINLGFFEIGMVYLVSKKKLTSLKKMKGIKIWAWEGDALASAIIESMNFISIPLPLPDVLSSLSTGIVDATYSPPLAIVALQWSTKIKYLLNYPLTYAIGAFLIGQKSWNKIPVKYHDKIKKICSSSFKKLNEANEKENNDSLDILKSFGVTFINFPKEDYSFVKNIRSKVIKKLEGKLFSKNALKRFDKELGKTKK